MIKVTITPKDFAIGELIAGMESVGKQVFPKTTRMFKMSAQLVQYTWKSYAMGSPIKGSSNRLKNPTGKYASSIKMRKMTPLNYEIRSDSKIAKYIEDGTTSYDMKQKHTQGRRSRVSRKGDPYIIIPIRHGTPGSQSNPPMPEQVYQKIKEGLKAGTIQKSEVVTGKEESPNAWDEMIARAKYQWGTRIKGTGDPNLEGMLIMNVSKGKSSRSEYVTFRIISVNSPAHKWIQPARPAMNITKHVVRNVSPTIIEMIQKGILEDLGV